MVSDKSNPPPKHRTLRSFFRTGIVFVTWFIVALRPYDFRGFYETIWKALGDFKLKSSASTETQQVVSMRYVKITNNDLHRVYSDFRQTTNSVGNHVSRLVLLTR